MVHQNQTGLSKRQIVSYSFQRASQETPRQQAPLPPPQPRPSPLSSSSAFLASSSQQPPATTSASPVSRPRPTATSVKEEATAAQAGQFVSSSTDAPHVPLNQPVPSPPSELPPPTAARTFTLGCSHDLCCCRRLDLSEHTSAARARVKGGVKGLC